METWLSEVQRVRIPRPKFGSSGVRRSNSSVQHIRPEARQAAQEIAKATEELRQALQEKLWDLNSENRNHYSSTSPIITASMFRNTIHILCNA